jgi:hypothetical protein
MKPGFGVKRIKPVAGHVFTIVVVIKKVYKPGSLRANYRHVLLPCTMSLFSIPGFALPKALEEYDVHE